MDVKLYNCFSPPAIGIVARDGGGVFISDRWSNSKVLTNPRDGSQLMLTVVQHISEMSVGVQVKVYSSCCRSTLYFDICNGMIVLNIYS